MSTKKKLKQYEVTFDSDCYAMSLVADPAVEVDFVYLSKDRPSQVFLEKNEKHLIVGAALIPDKPIYRNQDGEEFYIKFSRETIEKMAHDFIKKGFTNSFTEQHEQPLGGIAVVESWIKEGDGDKAASYGFDVPDGTWMIMSKVYDVDLWDKIKSGELNGYSIEAMVGLDEIKLNQHTMAKNTKNTKLEAVEITDGFWDKLRGIIADAMGKPQKSEEVEETVGEVVDAMEEEGGPKDENPKVVEAEVMAETPEEIADDAADAAEAVAETPAEEKENLQAVIDELEAKIDEKDAEIEELKKANAKLGKRPSSKPVRMGAAPKRNPRDVIEAIYNGTYFSKK